MAENKNSDELLYLQTELVKVAIKGPASHPLFFGAEFKEKESVLKVACNDMYEINLAGDAELVAEQNTGRSFLCSYRMRPLFFEQQNYQIFINYEEGHNVEFWHENINIREKVSQFGHGVLALTGSINFKNEIGMSDLIIRVDGKDYLKLTLEVFPTKISYKEDYRDIVQDVTNEVYNLVFDVLKKTYESFDHSNKNQSSSVEFFAIICKIYDDFMAAADMVINRPHHILKTEHVVMPSHKIKRIDNKTLRWIEKHSEMVKRDGSKVMVDIALAVKKYVTYDTNENRLTKYMLQNTVIRLNGFCKQYEKLNSSTKSDVKNRVDAMVKGIRRRLNSGFMKQVKELPANAGMSLVFSMAPGYRELYRNYLLLQHGLSVTGSIFDISVKDLAVLYEYWCFIKLNSLMRNRYELLSQDIVKVEGKKLAVKLVKGQQSRVRYRNPATGEMITLSYNPSYLHRAGKSATVAQKPDNVLQLEKKGKKVNYDYIFDAKYKVDAALEDSAYKKAYNTPGPMEEDINTMHRYRDAIVYKNGASAYERTMFGAYVLFPYWNEEEYKEHRFYKSIDEVNIGGLPFLPSATGLVTDMLDQLIADSPESAFERSTLPVGIEDRLKKVDWSRREVLIGTFRSNEQFQSCYDNNFYYIPEKLVKEENLPIHYVAMFQTPRIFSNNAGIHFYGEVLRTALVYRKDIKEVPQTHGRPEDRYYRFSIREWKRLDTPILPKESGFVNEFTNMFLLENAQYVPELLLRSEEEYRFYSELKRCTGKALEDNDSVAGFELDDVKVLFDNGRIEVYRDGNVVGDCSIADFSRRPNATFRSLQRKAMKV